LNPIVKQEKLPSRRTGLVFFLVFVMLAGLVIRLAYLQLTQGATLRADATTSRLDQMPVPAPRGFIYDRHNSLLVSDTSSFTLMYSGSSDSSTAEFQNLVKKIHSIIPNLSNAEITKRMTADPWVSVTHKIASDLTEQQVSYISEHQDEFPGCNIIIEPKREYVKGDLAGSVIGYLNSIPSDQAAYYQKQNYQPDAKVGSAGIEMQYESYLRGTDGKLTVEVDNQNHIVKNFGLDPAPIKGDDVQLNIDSGLQQVMQDALATQVKALQQMGKPAKDAAAVAMNPQTGEVYAMASYPSFNPEWFVDGIDKHLTEWQNSQNNWAIQGTFPPGSTEKPLTAMAALQDGIITPYTTVFDPGYFDWDGYRFHNWLLSGHGDVNLVRALTVSNDTYFYKVAYNYAKGLDGPTQHKYVMNRLTYYQQAFGLGVPKTGTGIDLPYEASGFMFDNGNPADLLFAAIGQNEEFTPISLAQYVSTIANGGKRMEPHVAREIIDPNGHVVKSFTPKVLNTVPVSQANIKLVQEGMHEVVNSPEGTAASIFKGASYKNQVAAKTGTAEVGSTPNNNDTSVFMGYAPYNNPQIAVVVVIPAGGESWTGIGPVSRKIFDYYFAHQNSFR
jgi:penicillin-binding protein 2